MTNASNNELTGLLEERYGPMPVRPTAQEESRARLVASLHALISFLLLNPHLPVSGVSLFGYVDHVETLERLAETMDAQTYGDMQRQFNVPGLPPQISMVVAHPRSEGRPL